MKIDLAEEFPRLGRAPIVEAVVDIWAKAGRTWSLEAVAKELADAGYEASAWVTENGPGQSPKEGGFLIRLGSATGKTAITLHRGRYEFHWLGDYEGWEAFSQEALRGWASYEGAATPSEIHQCRIRFINRIELLAGETQFEEYLRNPPLPPDGMELPFAGYFHRDQFLVPGEGCAVQVIRTIEAPAGGDRWRIIVDIDVKTTEPIVNDIETLRERMATMRWLKNKAFFGSVTAKAVELCR